MTAQEISTVTVLPGPKRYKYFVKGVTDYEQVWGLANENGWALMGDSSDRELVPVWPFPEFAEKSPVCGVQGYTPRAISLSDWMEKWLPGIERDGKMVAVFPTPGNNGVPVPAGQLQQDIEDELERYE